LLHKIYRFTHYKIWVTISKINDVPLSVEERLNNTLIIVDVSEIDIRNKIIYGVIK